MTNPGYDARGPVARGESWQLPIGDGLIGQLRFDHAFTMVFSNGMSVRIEAPFTFVNSGVDVECDPEAPATLASLLRLNGATAREAVVSQAGNLSIGFVGGGELKVPFDDHHEAFGISGNDSHDFKVVSLPGGGLAVFS